MSGGANGTSAISTIISIKRPFTATKKAWNRPQALSFYLVIVLL